MTPTATSTDTERAAAVRTALCRLVAERGFHGASMSAVAREAGVATGTAYVYYESKDALVLDTYLEVKRELGEAAVASVDPTAPAGARFRRLWIDAYRHLRRFPERARFLLQVDNSPYADVAHSMAMSRDGDPLVAFAVAPDIAAQLADLPVPVMADLVFGPLLHLAAADDEPGPAALDRIVRACWRAVTD